jgi:hypothetical protein
MKRRTVIIIVLAVLATFVGGISVGAWLKSGDASSGNPAATATQDPTTATSPATTTPSVANVPATTEATATNDPVLPTPAKGSLTQGREKKLFDGKITIPNTPAAWEEKSSDADSMTFIDKSNCSSGCPTIWFYDVSKGQNHVTFGDNPLGVWATDHCHGQGTDTTADFTAGGQPAKYRRLSCDGQDFFAWYVPSKKFLATTQDADGQIADPQIIQAVVASLVWNR